MPLIVKIFIWLCVAYVLLKLIVKLILKLITDSAEIGAKKGTWKVEVDQNGKKRYTKISSGFTFSDEGFNPDNISSPAKETPVQNKVLEPTQAKPKSNKHHAFAFNTYIAGISHKCSTKDIGAFLGTIKTEPSNPYDPNAIKVIRYDGKHLGYIPKDHTAQVHAMLKNSDNATELPCIGYIEEGYKYPLVSNLKVLAVSDNDALTYAVLEHTQEILLEKDDEDFIPMGVDIPGNTFEEKLKFLDEECDKIENYEETTINE